MIARLSSRPVRVIILSSVWDLFSDIISDFAEAVVKILGIMAPALIDMKPSVMTQFSKSTRVNPHVKYFTWAGYCTVPTVLFG
jgi:hypothetical protein